VDAITVTAEHDVVDLTIEPELPQDRLVAIIPEEPVRLCFPTNDERPPRIYSRRDGFPHDQVHTNYVPEADGLCLCIWEEKWPEMRRSLTAHALVERIRDWFTRMARGVLHQEGQALEPLIPATAHTLIIPPGPPAEVWAISWADQHEGRWTVSIEVAKTDSQANGSPSLAVLSIQLAPRVHGALRRRPQNLDELRKLCEDLGTDLNAQMRKWLVGAEHLKCAHEHHMLLVIGIPKLKEAGGEIGSWEIWTFMPTTTLSQLGEALGCTYFEPRTHTTAVRVPAGAPEGLGGIFLEHWRVVQRLDRATARTYAGSNAKQDRRLVAIGAGAIGSNVVVGTVRAGIGTWTIIDDDIVLPHNTVRQFHCDRAVGFPKARALEIDANSILAEGGTAEYIRSDVLNPVGEAEQIRHRMISADLVVDFSASPAVLGQLSDQPDICRAASFFFNPGGNDLVVLAEDVARGLRLDEIEAQYFLAVAADHSLVGHLTQGRLDFIRYANACQDLSHPLPPWQVQTLAGLAGGQLIRLFDQPDALAKVWQLDPQAGSIVPVTLGLAPVVRHIVEDWRFTVSEHALQAMRRHRVEAESDETGGILVGSFDLSRRVAHVLLALPAPPDSAQAPTYFIRGTRELKPIVDSLAIASAGVLNYLGEWHSHINGVKARPSRDDEVVYGHIARHIGPTGAPYFITICGEDETWLRFGRERRTLGEAVIGHGHR
jgi:hypothetical protein